MCRAGFLERRADPVDRRRAPLGLSPKGVRVWRQARRTSAAMERELRARCGAARVQAFREVLLAFVERHGGLDDVRALRARPAPERGPRQPPARRRAS
jgi:DNA-binding MarR family transcriptional regulator